MRPVRLARPLPALAAFTVSAAVAFTLVRPAATDAVARRPRAPDAVAGQVALEGDLVRAGQGWAVRVRAVNGAAEPRHCEVTATLTELVDSPMSRVIALPRPVWQGAVALSVPAAGEEARELALPRDVGARVSAARAPARARAPAKAPPAPAADLEVGDVDPAALPRPAATTTHRVQLSAACPAEHVG